MTTDNLLNIDDDDEGDVLDRLEELSIINIDEQDDSPSYGTASLPTPEPPLVDFGMRVASPYQAPLHIWYADQDGAEDIGRLCPPGAPLMKDMDSFADGSRCGSFEDLPATDTNEVGESIYPATEGVVALLPPPDSLLAFIEKWRTEVLEDTFLPVKRRRSPSPEEERCVRRTRPRTRAISLPTNFRAFTQLIGFHTTRSEPEAPD